MVKTVAEEIRELGDRLMAIQEGPEMCPEACCGKPVTECKCGPDCEHCDCHAKNKMDETTSAGSVAAVASGALPRLATLV